DASRCLDFVYADSESPISADGFLFSRSDDYPTALKDFKHGFAVLENLPCDVLITPHPSASRLWERIAADSLIDSTACRRYVALARAQLSARLQQEQSRPD
ncbi:MAG TPA: subclass B3 metallo-beta-lactamase, partial [Gemmatimonadaceae bacterium]|nr:subclass B3 metallo-beta-lactamase [Gemmatimonadaceae bacterium]